MSYFTSLAAILLALISISIFGFAQGADATTYFIATTGSDGNTCTQAQSVSTPKATFANVFTNCMTGGGHTLKVVAGTYTQALTNPPSGSSGAPTIIEGNTPGFGTWTLRPTTCADSSVVSYGGTWLVIRGFIADATNCSFGVRTTGGSDVVFEDFETFGAGVTNTGYTGGSQADRITLRRCKIHDVGEPALGNPNGHGVYFGGDNNLVEFCDIYNVLSHGIHSYSSAGPTNHNIARFNWVHNVKIGIGFYPGVGAQVYGNVVANGSGDGARVNGADSGVWYNNVFYNNTGLCMWLTSTANSNFVRNNLCLSNSNNTIQDEGGNTLSNNMLSTNTNLVVNAAANEFGPRAGSALIDAGVSAIKTGVTRPFNGAAPDIDAFENFTCPSASVNGNTMDVTCSMAFNSPVLPASSITGWTVNNGRTVTGASRVGDTIVRLTFDGAACGSEETWTFAYSGGNVTDSALIGNTKKQSLHTIGATGATNNCEGAPAPTPPPTPSSCSNLWNSTLAIPTGFGAAFNLFSSAKELLIDVVCGSTGATANIGNGSTSQYIYKTGYVWQNNSWSPFSYSGSSISSDNNWVIGSASKTISGLALTQKQSVLAYICDWNGSKWNCGCRDTACTTNYWNLQQFKQ